METNNQLAVYALVGSSGTGKSHKAIKIANQYNIELIIDDGLIINNARILAGKTAKRQLTRIGAIKTALFTDPVEAQKARKAIQQSQAQSVLILGTSKGMVDKIAATLELSPVAHYLLIEEVSTAREIQKAQNMRNNHASHVIPAPTVEVKKSFPETWIDPLKVFIKHNQPARNIHNWQEQTIVRPTFTPYGNIIISQSALSSIVHQASLEITEARSIERVHLEKKEDRVIISLKISLPYGSDLVALSREVQKKICYKVEFMTNLLVERIDITVNSLYFPSA